MDINCIARALEAVTAADSWADIGREFELDMGSRFIGCRSAAEYPDEIQMAALAPTSDVTESIKTDIDPRWPASKHASDNSTIVKIEETCRNEASHVTMRVGLESDAANGNAEIMLPTVPPRLSDFAAVNDRKASVPTRIRATIARSSCSGKLTITLCWPDLRSANGKLYSVPMLEGCSGVLAGRMGMPGGIYLDLFFIVMTSVTDLNTSRLLLAGRYYEFAFMTMAASWCAMLYELPVWLNLWSEIKQSTRQGYYTNSLISLRDSERSIEGILDLALSIYAMPYTVGCSETQFWQVLVGIVVALKGLVQFVRERDALQRLRCC